MAFTIYPAIDIRGGNCVRLIQGDYAQETVYSLDPLEVAYAWQDQNAAWVHLVDLDGAKAGHPVNDKLIGQIADRLRIPVQVGGGLRNERDVEHLLSLGVERVIIGTAAIENRQFVRDILKRYGERVAIGLDARNGLVATRGWLTTSEVNAEELAKELVEYGARTFIFTDISRDGMMGGPNLESILSLAQATGQSVIASGGVSRMDDLDNLFKYESAGVSGAIVGKALYTGSIDLETAIENLAAKGTDGHVS
jgi:phosphoribosylformimino-5-aminoimidazole carboxamide ribotide isomerase